MRDWTPDSLIAFSNSYWEICALHASLALDVFTPLKDGAMTPSALAAKLGCSERGLSALLTALCAMELLVRKDGKVALTPFSETSLCRGTDSFVGHIILHHRDLMPNWSKLDEAVREGRSTRGEKPNYSRSDEEREAFIMGMYNMAFIRSAQAVKAVDFSGRVRLLDLGGGPGSYAVRFCQTYPDLHAVIFDIPTTRPFAEGVVARHGLSDRIRFEGGDFFTDPLPKGFDVVWISHILHGSNDEESARLLSRAMECLNPGGQLLIQEFMLEDSCDGPLFSALFGLNMLCGTPAGKVYTESELKQLLEQAGACKIRRLPMPDAQSGTAIVMGEKK